VTNDWIVKASERGCVAPSKGIDPRPGVGGLSRNDNTMAPSAATAKFHITASALKSHFKHRCDRRLRWDTVASRDRGKPGIGWNVPRVVRAHSRPGIALLMAAGDSFEIDQLTALQAEIAAEAPPPGIEPVLHHAGFYTTGARTQVLPTPITDALYLFRQPSAPRFIAQVEIDPAVHPGVAAHFLQSFGLDIGAIALGPAKPDLIELLPPDAVHAQRRLRVWDFKGGQVARHEHFIQVAYYGMLIEVVLAELGITDLVVDTEEAVVAARTERNSFTLTPYRLAVADFLRNRMPEILATPAAEAHFHVHEGCMLCEYMEECRTRANASFDLSRIPYISSESKRRLLAEGFRAHPDLAMLDAVADQGQIEQLRGLGHDLSTNAARYIACAQALQDGAPRLLEQSTFQMPQYEDIRVVISAEQDAVTGTCFALGIKIYEGWDAAMGRPLGQEFVFVAETKGDEVSTLLLPFLQILNRFLEGVHAANQTLRDTPIDGDPQVVAAAQQLGDAQAALDAFKVANDAAMRKRSPEAKALRDTRDALAQVAKAAEKVLKDAQAKAAWELRRQQKRLHFYIYDTLDVLTLKELVERHLFDAEPPELLAELSNLVRLFPPESVLPDAETFRTIPATVVVQMLRTLVALPVAYGYDLRTVSDIYQPERGGYRFRTPYGFSWEHSNQIAFERIHDVWNGTSFSYQQRGAERRMEPPEILDAIKDAVRGKLRATDSIVRRLKADLSDRLLLRKEPFQLYTSGQRLQVQMLEALRIFTTLEASLDELDTKRTHTLPVKDRVASFVCIDGLRAETGAPEPDGSLWFTFDPSASDTKFEPDDFNLVLSPADDPAILLSEIDGDLFSSTGRWRYDPYKVTLKEYDLLMAPPRVRLAPDKPQLFMKKFDPSRTYVLDRLFIDYNSGKVFDVLGRLASGAGGAEHLELLLAEATNDGWTPFIPDIPALEVDFRTCLKRADADPGRLLNEGQWQAWRGVMREPLTLVWGPPGTGKTHTIAHMLIGYALAARSLGRPLRVLVSAFTHHAINNVLKKVADLTGRYNLSADDLQIAKLQRNAVPDPDLPARVLPVDPDSFLGVLENAAPCQVVGATVWAVHRAMTSAGDVVQPWFDVILVDEASQLKLPDALIAFASSKPTANIILAGDDRQLPPIIKGEYPDEHAHLLNSVFVFVRDRIDRQKGTRPDLEERILFQLEDNFRMNELLTAYPRDVLYRGRFFSTKPDIRIALARPIAHVTNDLLEFLLHPDRPVVLVRYRPPRSYTARNPLEAELAARLLNRLRELLIDSRTGAVYTPQEFEREGVAVLAPHRAQNSTIRQLLRNDGFGTESQPMPLVDTVDKLQGQERDVVVMSYGVADSEYAEAEAEFLLSRNRFNVAATRARHKLIVLCADTVLDLVPADQQVLYDAMMLKEFRRYCDSGQRDLTWTAADGQAVTFQVHWKEFRL
jgi:hypothetical protein